MIDILRGRGLLPQVAPQVSEESRLPLADDSVDLALLACVLPELEAPGEFLTETHRILRQGGGLVVLEWVPREEAMGPPVDERVSVDDARDVLQRSGFATVEEGLAKPSSYVLVTSRR